VVSRRIGPGQPSSDLPLQLTATHLLCGEGESNGPIGVAGAASQGKIGFRLGTILLFSSWVSRFSHEVCADGGFREMPRAAEAIGALAAWVQAGKLRYKVHVQHGPENVSATLGGCSKAAARASSSCVSRSRSYGASELAQKHSLDAVNCKSYRDASPSGTVSLGHTAFHAVDSFSSRLKDCRLVPEDVQRCFGDVQKDTPGTARRAAWLSSRQPSIQ
jgi:hypothetical protein